MNDINHFCLLTLYIFLIFIVPFGFELAIQGCNQQFATWRNEDVYDQFIFPTPHTLGATP
jgi:hypothetical protein